MNKVVRFFEIIDEHQNIFNHYKFAESDADKDLISVSDANQLLYALIEKYMESQAAQSVVLQKDTIKDKIKGNDKTSKKFKVKF